MGTFISAKESAFHATCIPLDIMHVFLISMLLKRNQDSAVVYVSNLRKSEVTNKMHGRT